MVLCLTVWTGTQVWGQTEPGAAATSGAKTSRAPIYQVTIEGPITRYTRDRLAEAVDQAERAGAAALLVLLHTPGGLMISMDEMCRKILNSRVPVLTFVYPPGSYAGSAGVYIMYSSHLSAMAPATNIGSATPVSMGGGGGKKKGAKRKGDRIPKTAGADDALNMKRKIINHARAQIRSFAQFHGRNARFAERTITEAANVTSNQALRLKAIDLVASSPEQLLARAHGRTVRMVRGNHKLDLNGRKMVVLKTDFRSRFLAFLSNPMIVNLLLMLGMLGIVGEVQYPGSVFPGVVGAICLILGLYALQTIDGGYAGLGLIVLGVIFFILEIKVTSYGMLSVAGLASMVMGSILMARSGDQLLAGTLAVMLTTTLAVAGVMLVLIYKATQVMRRKPVSGSEALDAALGNAQDEITSERGHAFVQGELWSARLAATTATDGAIAAGSRVRVVRREGLTLYVEPAEG